MPDSGMMSMADTINSLPALRHLVLGSRVSDAHAVFHPYASVLDRLRAPSVHVAIFGSEPDR